MKISRTFDLLAHNQSKFNKSDAFAAKINGQWKTISIAEFIQTVDQLSQGFMAMGIAPGDRVSIMSTNRPEWNAVDFALSQIGAVSVPIYPTVSESDLLYILKDAEVKLAFTGTAELYAKTNGLKSQLSHDMDVYCFDEAPGVVHWQTLVQKGIAQPDADGLRSRKDQVDGSDMLTLIYTSGTTGNPKGVMLSHFNIISNVLASKVVCPVNEKHRALSFLPISHIFERMIVHLYLLMGTSIYYAESIDTIGDNLKEVKPYVFTTVPRLLEKVYDKIVAKGEALTGLKKKLFFWALDLGLRYELDGANGWWYEFQLKIANKLIFSKWREALGNEVGIIVTGAAALQPRLARVFTAAQIAVLEGYGLTETSPVICVNNLEFGRKFGTVGTTIPGVEIKIAPDGEILCKGPNVMMGYYKNPELTAEVIKDGWFHTGDIGVIEDNKFLRITDRKKEIFKTSGGKYIAPQVLENKLKESVFIEQVMVLGENQKYAAALIVPAFATLQDWARQRGIADASPEALCNNPQVIALLNAEVEGFNKNFGSWETIKKIALLPKEWTIDGLELTPTLKLKRKIITQKYANVIATLFE